MERRGAFSMLTRSPPTKNVLVAIYSNGTKVAPSLTTFGHNIKNALLPSPVCSVYLDGRSLPVEPSVRGMKRNVPRFYGQFKRRRKGE